MSHPISKSHILSKSGVPTRLTDISVHYLIKQNSKPFSSIFPTNFDISTTMGPKRARKAKNENVKSDQEYSPKKEEAITIKLEAKLEEEALSLTIPDTPRYVHNSPREFKGRLGYACVNTYLRKQKPSVFSARTCRLDTVTKKGEEYVRELALLNIADLKTMIQWNEDHHIKFMRVSSDMFPFASHEKAGYDISFARKELKEVGDLAKKYNHRLTMHPGQYNQLVSLTPKVIANTIRELDYHAQMLDLMGLDQDAVMIIHMGGVYGDRVAALERFEKEYAKLPENIKRRLVLENDELGYSVSDLLPICTKLGIPLVLDWHHHHINPGNATDLISLLPQINKTWTDRGIKPKQHYSESRAGAVSIMEKRAHSDRVQALPPTTDDVDLMIEAKDKEQAVFHLYKLFDLFPVDDEVWIPASDHETTETKGRKSVKSAAKKRKAEEAESIKTDTIVDSTVKIEKKVTKGRKKAPSIKEKVEEIVKSETTIMEAPAEGRRVTRQRNRQK